MRLKEDLKDKIWKIQDGNVRLFIADLLEYLEELEIVYIELLKENSCWSYH